MKKGIKEDNLFRITFKKSIHQYVNSDEWVVCVNNNIYILLIS